MARILDKMGLYRDPIWTPTRDDLERSPMARFRDLCNQKYGLSLIGYHDLHGWSVDPRTASDFWMALFEYMDLKATKKPTRTFKEYRPKMFPSPQFFPEARLNFSGSTLSNRNTYATALLEVQEGSPAAIEISWGQLYSQVEKSADAMRASGVVTGDRIAALIANTSQAIALCLAALSIGAIWSSISPDFGAQGILDRLVQVKPKLVFTNTEVVYNGKERDLMPIVREWARVVTRDEGLSNVVCTGYRKGFEDEVVRGITWETFLKRGSGRVLSFEQLPFNQPAFIFYSSGTTGTPKCIVHSAGGLLLQIKKDYILQIGVLPTDTVFQYTTTSWIMWAFVLTTLSIGAKTVLYSGSPLYPDIKFMLRIISKLRVTIFGTSAKYLTELMDSKTKPRAEFDISSLRKVTSTGSVLPSDVAIWFYEHGFPQNVHLNSGSGGTDCACSFVGGTPFLPLYPNEIQAKALGMAVDVFEPELVNESPQRILSEEPGELVCTQPFPSQPVTFFGAGGDEKYFNSYFSTLPGIWVQGDLIKISNSTGGIQMLGRSDGVLNPSGVRFGSAEIYNVVRKFPDIEDSVCVGQRRAHDKDESVILFLKMKPGSKKANTLTEQLKKQIAQDLSKRHVPKYVFYVNDIPYSLVGKKLEIVVKNIVCGRKIKSNVIANPESLALYEPFFNVEEMARKSRQELSKL